MALWDEWKKGFYAWEDDAARQLSLLLAAPALVAGAGGLLRWVTQAKTWRDRATAAWWAT